MGCMVLENRGSDRLDTRRNAWCGTCMSNLKLVGLMVLELLGLHTNIKRLGAFIDVLYADIRLSIFSPLSFILPFIELVDWIIVLHFQTIRDRRDL